jgi:hypothetical protein
MDGQEVRAPARVAAPPIPATTNASNERQSLPSATRAITIHLERVALFDA